MSASLRFAPPVPREGFVQFKNAELFTREIGEEQPIIVLQGGPDFDHTYVLPAMDRLSDSYRLISSTTIKEAEAGRGVNCGSKKSALSKLSKIWKKLIR